MYSGLGSWDSFQGFSLARFGPGVRLRAEVQGFVLGSVWVSGPEQHCFNIFHVLMVVTAPGGPLGPAESLAPPKPDTLPPPPPPPHRQDAFNIFDVLVVITAWIEIGVSLQGVNALHSMRALRVLRAFRVVRLFKLFKYISSLRKIGEVGHGGGEGGHGGGEQCFF